MAPQQPHSRVFLVRRLIVLTVAGLLVWGLVALVSAGIGAVKSMFGATDSPTIAASGQQQNQGGGYTTCMPNGIDLLSVVGDGSKPQTTFAAGASPKFWFVITNTSSKPCYFNVGSKVQRFVVTSGSETIWTNAQCLGATANYRMLLQPGVATTSTPISWGRVHSSNSGCDAASGQLPATGGGASYHLRVTLTTVESNDVQFILN